VGKSADGLMALKWYKEYLSGDGGKLTEIADYCQQDVQVTRDIYLHGLTTGEVIYEDKEEGLKKISVNWNRDDVPPESEEESVQLSF
jgi:DEAD/DEAH box helicase domain-containing protein